jgi:alginate O-acetyltransferase complex protein AlgI
MSYTIEVYRGNQKAERHFGYYALYVMFYPQLVAGPIERPQNILHQLHEKHQFNYSTIVSGLRLILWGMFKKTNYCR